MYIQALSTRNESMFEGHRAKKAAEAYQKALAEWQAQRDGYARLLELAETFNGTSDAEIMLGRDEALSLFYKVTGASLIEERRGRGTYKGASQRVSIPIGIVHGRSVRYRVGQTRGHYEQGAPTPIDTGTVFVTNKRVIFQGVKQTRECLADLVAEVRGDLANIDTQRPTAPAVYPPNETAGSVGLRAPAPTIAGAVRFRVPARAGHPRPAQPAQPTARRNAERRPQSRAWPLRYPRA